MPFFRYSATDKSGAQTSGTVEATTPDEAMLKLVNSGLSVSQLLKAPDTGLPLSSAEEFRSRRRFGSQLHHPLHLNMPLRRLSRPALGRLFAPSQEPIKT